MAFFITQYCTICGLTEISGYLGRLDVWLFGYCAAFRPGVIWDPNCLSH